MIRNEAELSYTENMLSKLKASLDDLRTRVLPDSPETYNLMAEGFLQKYIEMRSQIDNYRGIKSVSFPLRSLISISLRGKGVQLGTVPASEVGKAVSGFRGGITDLVSSSHGNGNNAWIHSACDMTFSGASVGSVVIYLDKPRTVSLFQDEADKPLDEAIDKLMAGVQWATETVAKSSAWRSKRRKEKYAVLKAVKRILPPEKGDVDQVVIAKRDVSGIVISEAILPRSAREKVNDGLTKLVKKGVKVTAIGTMRGQDLDHQTFILRKRLDSDCELKCKYGASLSEKVEKYMNKLVKVEGKVRQPPVQEKVEHMTVTNIYEAPAD